MTKNHHHHQQQFIHNDEDDNDDDDVDLRWCEVENELMTLGSTRIGLCLRLFRSLPMNYKQLHHN